MQGSGRLGRRWDKALGWSKGRKRAILGARGREKEAWLGCGDMLDPNPSP